MMNKNLKGHLAALITIFIWGTTFISTKLLLVDFKPIEILFFRFLLGLLLLIIIYPKKISGTTKKQEITIAPFFTAVLSYLVLKEERLKRNFFIGFVLAMIGISLISFNTSSNFKLNPLGDLLALLAALIWAVYSILTKKISEYGFNTIQVTRRMFMYGIIFMLFTLIPLDFKLNLKRFANPVYLGNIVFLGVGASAGCFVTWNFAIKILGTIKTSIYIYIVPVVTVITSFLVLNERITILSLVGTLLTLMGLFLSQGSKK